MMSNNNNNSNSSSSSSSSSTTTTTTTEATIGYDESAATELMTTFLDQVNLIVILI
jgi:hypothetical protein